MTVLILKHYEEREKGRKTDCSNTVHEIGLNWVLSSLFGSMTAIN